MATQSSYKSSLSSIANPSGYVPDREWTNYVVNLYRTDMPSYQGLASDLFNAGTKGVWKAGGAAGFGEDDLFINAEYNPFRSPAEWSKDLASNLAYQNTMGESTSSGWGHDLVRNTLRVAGDVIPAAFGAVVGNVPGAIIGALGTGLKKGGDVAGAGGSPGEALKTGLSSAAIAALASYAGSAVSGALSGAADVGGALDQGWSSTGMPTEGMLSSAPQGNILSNLAGTLAKTGTKTGLSTLATSANSGSGIDPSANASISTSRIPRAEDSVTSSAGSLADPETFNLSNLVQQLMQTANKARLTNRASRYGLAARGLFPNRYSGLIGG